MRIHFQMHSSTFLDRGWDNHPCVSLDMSLDTHWMSTQCLAAQKPNNVWLSIYPCRNLPHIHRHLHITADAQIPSRHISTLSDILRSGHFSGCPHTHYGHLDVQTPILTCVGCSNTCHNNCQMSRDTSKHSWGECWVSRHSPNNLQMYIQLTKDYLDI